jgi:hypothetical protein
MKERMMLTEEALRRLLDIQEITTVVNDVCAAADAKNWDACARWFAHEVEVRVGPPGSSPAQMSPRQLVSQWGRVLAGCDLTLHALSNHRVEVTGDAATCQSVVNGFHHARGPAGQDYCITFGAFHHALARTDEGWRIRALEFRQLYALGNPAILGHGGD